MWQRYHRDLDDAWTRVRAVRSQLLDTPDGRVEYVTSGAGRPVLMSHGILGGHVESLGMVATYVGDHVHAIAPSRFGYFRSDLPADATPALQADAYATLLDHVGVDEAVIVGYSAGGTSAIEFALHYPERTSALILASSALPSSTADPSALSDPPRFLRPLMSTATRTDLPLWLLARLMPSTLHGLMGIPRDYPPTATEAATIDAVVASIFPVHLRREGFVFDTFVGNPYVRNTRLEHLTVPTLLVHAADDSLAPYANAEAAAERILDVELVTIPRGGHLFLGQETRVRSEINAFVGRAATAAPAAQLAAANPTGKATP